MDELTRKVMNLLDDLGKDLSPEEWMELLDTVSSDVEMRLEAAKEESGEDI